LPDAWPSSPRHVIAPLYSPAGFFLRTAFARSRFMLRRKGFRFRRGQKVVIASGKLAGLVATVQSYCAQGRLTLAVDTFTRGVLIRISERHVRPSVTGDGKGSS
jgi:hypothetical protein